MLITSHYLAEAEENKAAPESVRFVSPRRTRSLSCHIKHHADFENQRLPDTAWWRLPCTWKCSRPPTQMLQGRPRLSVWLWSLMWWGRGSPTSHSLLVYLPSEMLMRAIMNCTRNTLLVQNYWRRFLVHDKDTVRIWCRFFMVNAAKRV